MVTLAPGILRSLGQDGEGLVDPPGGVTLGQPPSASTVLKIETANVAALTITPEQVDLKTVPVVVRTATLACGPLGEQSLAR